MKKIIAIAILVAGCKAGDIGSSSSSSNAAVDNSTTDNSINGETHCSTTISDSAVDGTCSFSHDCNGVQVSAGDFPAAPDGTCATPTPTPTPTLEDGQ